MTIRELHSFELPACLAGGHEFIADAKLPGGHPFNDAHFLKVWHELIEEGRGFVIGLFDDQGVIYGTLAAVVADNMFTGVPTATECWWYVLKGHRSHGVDLLEAFGKTAKAKGARMLAMIHLLTLQPEKLCSVYQYLGYEEVERYFVKEVA